MKQQIFDIFQGWGRYFLNEFNLLNPDIKAETKRRLNICFTCEFRIDKTCSKIVKGNNVITDKLVRGCGCNIAAKTLAGRNACPASKW